MKQIYFLLLLFFSLLSVSSQEDIWKGKSVKISNGNLEVSANGRYIQHKNGTPFFYLGDTAWELFHRLNEEETEMYLENRRAKGFTVIQAVVLAEHNGLNTTNRNGDKPLIDNDPLKPNENYFKWVDKVIKMAEKKGLYIGLLPTWGDKVDKKWGVGPEIFNKENAYTYGAWLGKRYQKSKNIIWIVGGDRPGGEQNYEIWEAMAKSIKSEDNNHLMTFHPSGDASSSQWFHNSEWLDFNMAQTGHCHRRYEFYSNHIVNDYNKAPVKPCMDGEPNYENHPICWKPDEQGWFDDVDVRLSAYWSLFSGAFGYTYGCHDIWQMLDEGRTPVGFARGNWKVSLDLPGAYDMIHIRRLLEPLDWDTRKPVDDIIVSDNTSPKDRIVALAGKDYILIYFPTGKEAVFNLTKLELAQNLSMKWFDPRTGEYKDAGGLQNIKNHKITPPTSGHGNDWILVIGRTPK
ncbi:MAG: glycoside hydrolase family 140 protein [Prevotella sp.]|jgi:hypothetical protein|nr:glycoside hydrolase family 140 protein [Prevotella sp.]